MPSPFVRFDDTDIADVAIDDDTVGDDAVGERALDDDASQDPRHVEPGPAIEFKHLVVPDDPPRGPTIGEGPDDLPPYTRPSPQ